jgi:hypothetical protein
MTKAARLASRLMSEQALILALATSTQEVEALAGAARRHYCFLLDRWETATG